MLWLGLCVGIAAWCLLSLGLEKHHRQAFAGAFRPKRARAMRAVGWVLLAADFAWFVQGWGWAQGPIFWTAALIVSALAWSLALTLWPKASPKLAFAAALSGLATLVLPG